MNVAQSIEQSLAQHFSIIHLQLENESYMHSVPENSETHFKLTLVCNEFEAMGKVKRHQAIYAALSSQLEGPVHALSIHAFSAIEWQENAKIPKSPDCMGGGS